MVTGYHFGFIQCLMYYFAEDVIRRRLLIDGDGTGDDRRLNVLLKTLIKWSTSTDEKAEERLEYLLHEGLLCLCH